MKAIEKAFPTIDLAPVATLESWRKDLYRPIYYAHKWWAHRLGSAFRAIVLGALCEADKEIWAEFYSRHSFSDKVVLDPFMGSGTTLGEVLKLGGRAVGVDINPVSYFMVNTSLTPVKSTELKEGFKRVEDRAKEATRQYYKSTWPATGEVADLLYTFWVKLITCPTCGQTSRLFSKWIFSANAYPKKKPNSRALCPKCGEINIVNHFAEECMCSSCGYTYNPQVGPAKRSSFVCEHCSTEHSIGPIYRRSSTPPDHQMYALMLLLPNGEKVYKRPDESDHALYHSAEEAFDKLAEPLVPSLKIPEGINTDQARSYNYLYWHQMFNKRQLLCLHTILEAILQEASEDIRNQLLLLFSGTLEFNNMFCSFKGEGTGAVRHLFSHHILKPERTPLENNVWGLRESSGAFAPMFERRILEARAYAEDPFELRIIEQNGVGQSEKVSGINHRIKPRLATSFKDIASSAADALILTRDSSSLPIPDSSIDAVITDPPYFDNVNYSELADFFYVWLQLALRGSSDAFSPDSTRREGEVQSDNARSFGALLCKVFTECYRVLKPDGLLVFTFHHSKIDAWLGVLHAIVTSGFEIIAVHPTKAEMSVATPKSLASEPIDIDMIIVCKARQSSYVMDEPDVQKVIFKAQEQVVTLRQHDWKLSLGDLFVIAMSHFMLLTQNWNRIIEAGAFDPAVRQKIEQVKVALLEMRAVKAKVV